MFQLIPSPAEDALIDVVQKAQDTLFIVAPYIKMYGANLLLEHGRAENVRILTNLNNVSGAGYDIDALVALGRRFSMVVSSLGKLHAKVYVADGETAFITSSNLTYGGLRDNYEYGILVRKRKVVRSLVWDLERYFALGNIFALAGLEQLQREVAQLHELQRELRQTPEARKLRLAVNQIEDSVREQFLQNRARGRTVNAVFSETILYLLRTRGPLTTRELHPLIQGLHPDICDDTIDRVINGQHFGKKWKHLVRNAQQHLKSRGAIELVDGRWRLIREEYL